MKNINFLKDFFDKIKRNFEGLGLEVVVIENNSELTRFAQSYIHQNVAESNLDLRTFKLIDQDRVSVTNLNSIDLQMINKEIKKATELMKVAPKLDYHYSLPKPKIYKIKSKYSERTANFTLLERARQISNLIKKVNKKGYEASGVY